MEIHDLKSLRRDDKQSNLYNLFDTTFAYRNSNLGEYTVPQNEEMRIDLVCNNVYLNVNQVDLLCNVNQILNPLNIRGGDVILYPDPVNLDVFKVTPALPPEQRDSLLTPQRANIKDPRRQQFLENNYQLPPTMLPTPTSPITVGKNQITISAVR